MLREIGTREEPGLTRADVATTYGLTLVSSERASVDWGKVNRAIIARWSRSGLEWIKKAAHKQAEQR